MREEHDACGKESLEVLLRWRGEIEASRAREAQTDAEELRDMGVLWEQFKAEATREGIARGRVEGRSEVLGRLFERRLQRALTQGERTLLQTRMNALGDERLSDLVLECDGPALAAWLADPDAR